MSCKHKTAPILRFTYNLYERPWPYLYVHHFLGDINFLLFVEQCNKEKSIFYREDTDVYAYWQLICTWHTSSAVSSNFQPSAPVAIINLNRPVEWPSSFNFYGIGLTACSNSTLNWDLNSGHSNIGAGFSVKTSRYYNFTYAPHSVVCDRSDQPPRYCNLVSYLDLHLWPLWSDK